MSRRNNVTEPSYGQIKLKCPRRHDVGVILVPRRDHVGRQTLYRGVIYPEAICLVNLTDAA